VRRQRVQNSNAPRPLGRGRQNLACVFCGSGDKTSRKRKFEFRPMPRAGKMTHPDQGAYLKGCL